jgi:anthranilate synthase component 1
MVVERYSHVMHIVSNVFGQLRDDQDAASLLRATFPAGTLSGAPKVRAMQIISELEGRRRGVYGGAIGYLGFGGDMDTCIAIRTISMRDGVAYLQAGAGIVADSDPADEHQECLNKLAALGAAIDQAETGVYGP